MVKHEQEFLNNIQSIMLSISRKLRPVLEKHLQPYGITPPQFNMMFTLEREGACRVTHLADIINVKPSAITVIMDRLIERQLVLRYHSEVDRRVVMMELSENGKQVLAKMMQSYRQIMGQYFAQFTQDELAAFLELFQKLDAVITTTKIDFEQGEK
ncbi:MarR family winged helix-turn-helix transcriptional regulator [Paenibacillus xerothermodurans]|nr:MarR family transcriptional regulator [Paenibacillus xerothermodurans]